MFPLSIVAVHVLMLLAVTIARSQYFQTPFISALGATTALGVLYLTTVIGATLVYRAFLNPLNRFPGPYGVRLAALARTYVNRDLKGHFNLLRLHRQHGHFVRIGPNDLSVTDPDAVQVISAPGSKCYKAEW